MIDDLDYDTHVKKYKLVFGIKEDGSSNNETFLYAIKQAQSDHSLAVLKLIQDLHLNSVELANKLLNQDARHFMLYGAGRRLSMISSAYHVITSVVNPEREEPLTYEDEIEVTKELNVLYMNIRGVLDNYAWCFAYEKEPDLIVKLTPNQIGLFSHKFRRLSLAFAFISDEIKVHDEWERDLATRRDPVAHRIPLYVPPSSLTPDEQKTYHLKNDEYYSALNSLDFTRSDVLFEALYELGSFYPCFIHNPIEPAIPIYPTVPTDLAHLIKIGKAIERFLLTPN